MVVPAPRSAVSRALRGGVVGLVVCLVLYLSFVYTKTDLADFMREHPERERGGTVLLQVTLAGALRLGIPISYVVGLLVAWALRLRNPWAVPLVGLFAGALVLCAWTSNSPTPPPFPALVGSVVLVALFAGAAVITSRSPSTPSSELPRSA